MSRSSNAVSPQDVAGNFVGRSLGNRYADAVARIVDALEAGGSAGWQRMDVREVLGPQQLRLYAQDVVHELEHHLMDIGGNDPPGPSA